MRKFRVMVMRDCTQYAHVEVEAENEDAAEEAAQDWIDNGNPLDWDLSDETGQPETVTVTGFFTNSEVEEIVNE